MNTTSTRKRMSNARLQVVDLLQNNPGEWVSLTSIKNTVVFTDLHLRNTLKRLEVEQFIEVDREHTAYLYRALSLRDSDV